MKQKDVKNLESVAYTIRFNKRIEEDRLYRKNSLSFLCGKKSG